MEDSICCGTLSCVWNRLVCFSFLSFSGLREKSYFVLSGFDRNFVDEHGRREESGFSQGFIWSYGS